MENMRNMSDVSNVNALYDNLNIVEKIKLALVSNKIYNLLFKTIRSELDVMVELLNKLQKIDTENPMYDILVPITKNDIIDTFVNKNQINYKSQISKMSMIDRVLCNKEKLYEFIFLMLSIYVNSEDVEYDKSHAKYFAYFGNIEMVEKLNNNDKDNIEICAYIAGSDNSGLLKWAHENGYKLSSFSIVTAAVNDCTRCIEYLKSTECYSPSIYLECLKYPEYSINNTVYEHFVNLSSHM